MFIKNCLHTLVGNQLSKTLALAVLAMSFASSDAVGATIQFQTGFEGSSTDPFFDLLQLNSSITLSNSQFYAGSQSVKITSPSGSAQRSAGLTHSFSQPLKGTASVAFYDVSPGQQTLYELLNLNDSISGLSVSIGTQDFDAFCYSAGIYSPTIGSNGPNAACGIFPQYSTTSVQRTAGWHLFSIAVLPSMITLSIDGGQVYSLPGNYTFDSVTLNVFGPGGRPGTTAYFDEFAVVATTSGVPEVSTYSAGVGLFVLYYFLWRSRSTVKLIS